ncbi:ribosyldihydronicotinamide dehydrogenase [quinone] isoform X3 [Struthio camelus]|uniref:ribosyldihydronicotinamide dehydrogenase [quinone] isoform X3 n=2 Tax=Struthio camelus TaxID=8801 RepID=UPI003603F85C
MDLRGDLIKYLTKRPYWTLRTETTTCFQKMAGRKVLIVYAHQEPKSLNGSLKSVAVEELGKQGCSVTVSDLYAMQFEPRATRNDIVGCLLNSEQFNYGVEAREAYKRGNLSDDLIEEQKKVQEADLLIFQFPLYWFSMPAIMKGWMDRVLVEGFAHKFPDCYDSGLLKDKLALFSFTTGGSREMYAQGGISGDIRYLLWPMQSSTASCTTVVSKSLLLTSALLRNMSPRRKGRRCCLLGPSV